MSKHTSTVIFLTVPPLDGKFTSSHELLKRDFDTDVLWKPPRMSARLRTMSSESTDSEGGRRTSFSESGPSSPPIMDNHRRFSISEMLGFSGTRPSLATQAIHEEPMQRKKSLIEDERVQEIMRRQKRVLMD